MRLTNKKSNHLNTRLVQYSTIRCVQLSDGLEHKWWYSELDLEACWSKMSSYKMVNQVTVPSNNYQIPLLFGIWSKYLESYCSCKWINLTAVQRDYRDIQLLCVYSSSQVFRGYFKGETLKHKGEKTRQSTRFIWIPPQYVCTHLSNTRPLDNRTHTYHSNTCQAWYSDGLLFKILFMLMECRILLMGITVERARDDI